MFFFKPKKEAPETFTQSNEDYIRLLLQRQIELAGTDLKPVLAVDTQSVCNASIVSSIIR